MVRSRTRMCCPRAPSQSTTVPLADDDDFFWEVNEALEGRYTAKRQETEENQCVWWFVEHTRVAVRDGPASTAKIIDGLRQGALVHVAEVKLVDPGTGKAGSRWVKLHKDESKHFNTKSATGARAAGTRVERPSHGFTMPLRARAGALWMLADGHSVGLDKLLRAAPPEIDWAPFSQLTPQLRTEPAAKLMALEVRCISSDLGLPSQSAVSESSDRPSAPFGPGMLAQRAAAAGRACRR